MEDIYLTRSIRIVRLIGFRAVHPTAGKSVRAETFRFCVCERVDVLSVSDLQHVIQGVRKAGLAVEVPVVILK